MHKKVLILALSVVFIVGAACFYFRSMNDVISTDKTIENGDAQLTNNVIEIEKDLVLVELRSISFDEFKKKTNAFVHSYNREAYFDGKERVFNDDIGSLVVSTKTPIYEYISKVYTSNDKAYKYIFIKIPLEGTTSQWSKEYIFKNENGEWKVFSDNNYYLMVNKKEPKRIIEKFTNFNGSPIEYEYMKILE